MKAAILRGLKLVEASGMDQPERRHKRTNRLILLKIESFRNPLGDEDDFLVATAYGFWDFVGSP